MPDTTTPRVSTERVRELVDAREKRDPRVKTSGYPLTVSDGKRHVCATCGAVAHNTLFEACEAWNAGARTRKACGDVLALAPDLAADLIAARERIAALEAERDARVTVEEHARAVREAVADTVDNADVRCNAREAWLCSQSRRDLLATLTRHVGPERAAALVDGAGGGE